jgi:FAD/FMN-containing dehydrogenase
VVVLVVLTELPVLLDAEQPEARLVIAALGARLTVEDAFQSQRVDTLAFQEELVQWGKMALPGFVGFAVRRYFVFRLRHEKSIAAVSPSTTEVPGATARGAQHFLRDQSLLPSMDFSGSRVLYALDMAQRKVEAVLIERLVQILGSDGLELRPAELQYFAEDALRGRGAPEPAETPLAVARPATAEEAARVLALAAAASLPVVPYGAGTGLMGGARSSRSGIVLDTARLNTVDVMPADRLVWAGAGAILADVDAALQPHGLCLGHDPWTFPVATVGGTISTNGLGYRGGRYGGMADQVVAMEVALADGTWFRTRAVRRHSAGPNLGRLFAGAEGTLGVITAAALQAQTLPERRELRAYQFETFEAGFEAVDAMAGLGLRPSLLDFGEEHASPWPDLAARAEEPPLLYLGFEGFREEVTASWQRADALVRLQGGAELPRREAETFWEGRHVVAQRFARGRRREAIGRNRDIAFDYIHVALPPSKVLEYRECCHVEAASSGVGLLECGLWTAPDFFSAVLVLPAAKGGHEALSRVIDRLLMACQDLGGSMEYVHGAGYRLAHLMPREHGDAMRVLRRLKAALDPEGILNPEKLGLGGEEES